MRRHDHLFKGTRKILTNSVVVTSGPITADAATAKVVGIKKSITVSASATNKVTGLSKAEKNIVKVTKKGKKFTIKGLKAGKATFKIGKKSYTVKVGATTVKAAKTKLTLTKGKKATLKFTAKSGNGDTLTFKASNKNVTLAKKSAKIAKSAASVKATAKKAGKTTITATSKATGKKATVTVTVKNPAKPATTTPGASNTPVATATGSATNTPEATATATATASGSATNTPDVTATPVATATATPVATGSATNTPEATEVPTEAPTKAPEVVTGGTITVTTNVSGASIKVVSGTTVVATGSATTVLPNGTYTVIVTKEGYKEATQLVTVNGNITVNIELEKEETLEVKSVSALNTQEKEVSLTDLPASGKLVVTFNKAVKEETVNVNTVRIFESATNVPLSIAANKITLSNDKTVAYIDLNTAASTKGTEYKVVLKDIATEDGKKLAETTTNFTVSKMAVVSGTDYFDNSDGNYASYNNSVDTDIRDIKITYDAALDASTITTANISLIDVKTKEKMSISVTPTGTNDGFVVTPLAPATFVTGKQYIVTVNDKLSTSVGDKVEAYSSVFAVGAQGPFNNLTLSNSTVKTIDGKGVGTSVSDLVWPNTTAGMKETATVDTYYAGLNIVIVTSEKWDAASVKDNVQLVEKETKDIVDATITYNSDAKQLSIVPNANLKESTTYSIQFKGGLKTDLGIFLDPAQKDKVIDAKTYSFKTLDVTAPTVVSLESKDGLASLTTGDDHTFTLTFSEDVDLAKVKSSVVLAKTSMKNDDPSSIASDKLTLDSDYTITSVPGKADTYTIKVLKGKLDKNQAYKIMVLGKDLYGTALISGGRTIFTDTADNKLQRTTTVAFTTEGADVTGPVVTTVYKGQAISDDDKITEAVTNVTKGDWFTFEFNEKVASSINNASKIKLQTNSTGRWTDVTTGITSLAVVKKGTDDYGIKFQVTTENVNFADAQYRVVLEAGAVKDANTNENTEEYVFEFTASAANDTAPKIEVGTLSTASTPVFTADGTFASVDVKSVVTFGFAEANIAEIPEGSIVVKDADGNVVEGKIEDVSTETITNFTATGKRYIFTPSKDLSNDTTYTVTVEGLKDIAGNKIDKAQFQFKTVAAATKVTSCTISNGDTAVDLQKTIKFTVNNETTFEQGTYNSLTLGQYALVKASGLAAVTPTYVQDGKTNSLILTTALDKNTKYILKICASANETKTITFTTGSIATDDVKAKLKKLKIDDADFFTGGTGSEFTQKKSIVTFVDGTIKATFNEEIKKDDVKVTIKNITDSTRSASVLSTTLGDDEGTKNQLTITTLGITTGSYTYEVTISGVKDKAGNVTDDIVVYVTTPAGA